MSKRDDLAERAARVRREPPPFRGVTVRRTEPVTPRLTRVILAGPDLKGLEIDDPAASVRVLLPTPGTDELVVPEWNGNEFLLPDGTRPAIRTLTPRRLDAEATELEVQIVVHEGGVASEWATEVGPGDPAAVSGPGRGYTIDPGAPAYLLAGDETAIPAISQLLEEIPSDIPADVHIEVGHPDARHDLPGHDQATVSWHDLAAGAPAGQALVEAVKAADIPEGARVWVAGEAAAVQRIRRHLSDERGLPRSQTTVRGYWKRGRGGE